MADLAEFEEENKPKSNHSRTDNMKEKETDRYMNDSCYKGIYSV